MSKIQRKYFFTLVNKEVNVSEELKKYENGPTILQKGCSHYMNCPHLHNKDCFAYEPR
jgi:hypothetical protein